MATVNYEDELRKRTGGNTGISGGLPQAGPTVRNVPAPASTPGAAPNPGNQRESFHWERIPDAYRNIPGIMDWANDPNIDPNQKIQQFLSQQRASAAASGGRVAADDVSALRQVAAGAQRPQSQAQMPGFQFDDPYTKMLEGVAQTQMGETRSNPALDQLLGFLNRQFTELSESPGYSPQELAMLRTQAFEPVEDYRQASKQRALERTAARGMLPSSGLNELDMRDIDIAADRARTQLDRDLAIAGLDRRDADLRQALNIGQLAGVQIPQAQRGEELALASLLYDLPRRALQDALAVQQGSPTSGDLFGQAVQLAGVNQQAQQANQQRWAQIAKLLQGLDF